MSTSSASTTSQAKDTSTPEYFASPQSVRLPSGIVCADTSQPGQATIDISIGQCHISIVISWGLFKHLPHARPFTLTLIINALIMQQLMHSYPTYIYHLQTNIRWKFNVPALLSMRLVRQISAWHNQRGMKPLPVCA